MQYNSYKNTSVSINVTNLIILFLVLAFVSVTYISMFSITVGIYYSDFVWTKLVDETNTVSP